MGCACAQGIGDSLNTYMGPVPGGVPNPFTPMLHSYPTRYHGPIYTRPMYNLPYFERPNDFAIEPGLMGLGADEPSGGIPDALKVIALLGIVGVVALAARNL